MMGLLICTAALLAGYLSGSIPVAYLIGRGVTGIDVRSQGSGNVGATNLARIAGWKWGIACIFFDAMKGALPTLAFLYFFRWSVGEVAGIMAGVAAIIGHMYTFWLKGSGGKGVSTATGFLLALAPGSTLYAFLVFAIVGPLATRTISAGAIAAAAVLPLVAFSRESGLVGTVALLVSAAVIWKHRDNIERLANGTERRLWQGLGK